MRAWTFSLLVVPCLVHAQASTREDPLTTARPSFSDTTSIVPVRSLQLEAGLSVYAKGRNDPKRADFGEALLRYGLVPRVELRLTLPTYTVVSDGPKGLDNTGLGASYYVGKAEGFDVGIVGSILVPSGDKELRNGFVTPVFELNLGREVGKGGMVGGTLQGQYTEDEIRRLLDVQASVYFQQAISAHLSAFVEFAGFYDRDDAPRNYVHVGAQRPLGRNSAVDLHGGIGLGSAAREFVGVGYAVRF